MPRRHALNNILIRKQLLITEAEVHREQMREDFRVIGRAADGLGRKAKSFGTVASVVSLVVGGLTALRGVRIGTGTDVRCFRLRRCCAALLVAARRVPPLGIPQPIPRHFPGRKRSFLIRTPRICQPERVLTRPTGDHFHFTLDHFRPRIGKNPGRIRINPARISKNPTRK
jgi:hypothetical protein